MGGRCAARTCDPTKSPTQKEREDRMQRAHLCQPVEPVVLERHSALRGGRWWRQYQQVRGGGDGVDGEGWVMFCWTPRIPLHSHPTQTDAADTPIPRSHVVGVDRAHVFVGPPPPRAPTHTDPRPRPLLRPHVIGFDSAERKVARGGSGRPHHRVEQRRLANVRQPCDSSAARSPQPVLTNACRPQVAGMAAGAGINVVVQTGCPIAL